MTTLDTVRAATYLQARVRIDARFKPSGKTRKSVKCLPPNKKCGQRCIPPNWNCRLTGGGLDTHSRVVEFDPVRGTGSIIRGTKNVIEGYQKKDPEKITRGIKGIERGIVKITPGDTVEKKHKFRKRVQAVGNIAFLGIISALALKTTHSSLKNFKGYRDGLGADIDRAAATSIRRVVDTWDAGVDRVGLTRIFGTGRAQVQSAGANAATRLGRQGTLTNLSETRLTTEPRSTNYLQTRARLRGGAPGISSVNSIDAEALSQGWTQSQWEARKIQALYSMQDNGRSVFAAPAAHELLAAQWGFQLPARSLRETGRLAETALVRHRLLPEAISQLHNDLKADIQRRNIPLNAAGINVYAAQLLQENPSIISSAPNARLRRQLEQEFRLRLQEVAQATSSVQQRSIANNAYTRALTHFDEYFSRAAENLSVNSNNETVLSRLNPNSPYGDAMVGLSRLHHGQGRVGRATNRDAAVFLNSWYFHSRVQRRSEPYNLRSAANAVKYASSLSGQAIRSPEEALGWFQQNGYSVRIPRSRGGSNPSGPSTPPPRSPRGPRKGPSSPRTPTNSPLIDRLNTETQEEYMQRAKSIAQEQIRRNFRRTDADAVTRGKPCGKSHIPKAHKCHSEVGVGASPAATTQSLANKQDKAYHTRRVASLVARLGAIGGGAAVAYVAGREAIREVKKGPTSGDLDKIKGLTGVALTGAFISSAAVRSIEREKATTFDSDQLVDRYETLKKEKDVDPKVVTQLQTFIKDADIDSQRVSTQLILGGLAGYFDTAKPDRIHITGEGLTVSGAGTTYTKGVDNYMKYRAKASASIITQNDKTTIDKYQRNFSASGWIKSKEGKADYLIAHEIAHAIHYRSKFATPKAVVVNGKRYEGADLQRELARSTSYYGQSDLFKKSNSTTNYYDQGNRLETYAENFALYVGNSRSMKEYFPVSYEWTRQTTEYALKQKPKVRPRPFLDVVSDLSKGAQQFEPQRLRARRDSPEDDARILQLLRQMQSAAVEGDTTQAMALFAQAQELPQDVRFMFGSFLETAFMYAQLNAEGEDGTD